jgi:hypothetical protein
LLILKWTKITFNFTFIQYLSPQNHLVMKVLNLILALLFFSFAAVQYNDPDPWAWAALYLYLATACGMAAFGKSNRWMLLLGLAVSGIWMLTLLPSFIHWISMGMPNIVETMKAEQPHVELTREFLGLLLCSLVFAWQLLRLRKQ